MNHPHQLQDTRISTRNAISSLRFGAAPSLIHTFCLVSKKWSLLSTAPTRITNCPQLPRVLRGGGVIARPHTKSPGYSLVNRNGIDKDDSSNRQCYLFASSGEGSVALQDGVEGYQAGGGLGNMARFRSMMFVKGPTAKSRVTCVAGGSPLTSAYLSVEDTNCYFSLHEGDGIPEVDDGGTLHVRKEEESLHESYSRKTAREGNVDKVSF